MRCPHCQSELDPQETFCGNCGQPVPAVTAPRALPTSSNPNNWMYIALVLLAGAALGVWYFKDSLPPFPGGKSGSKTSPTASAQSTVTATQPTTTSPTIVTTPVPSVQVTATVQPGTLVLTSSPPPPLSPPPYVPPPASYPPPQVIPPSVPRTQVRAVINDPDGFTNVRAGPGLSYAIQTRVLEGEVFTAIASSERWWRVITKDGITGYMHRSRIRVIE